MPRIVRALTDNACYHLINRGNGRQQIFHKDGDYRSFIDLLQQALEGLVAKYSAAFRPEGLKYIAAAWEQTKVFKMSIETISGKARR